MGLYLTYEELKHARELHDQLMVGKVYILPMRN